MSELFLGVVTTISIIAICIAWEMVKYSKQLKEERNEYRERVDK